jgi:hypothetical protein
MKIVLLIVAVLSVFSVNRLAHAADLPNVGAAMLIADARLKNANLMKQYTWESRTELTDNGAVKDIRLEQVIYGPGGQLQRTLINDQPSPLPSGFIRKMMAENDQKKTAAYIKGLGSLLDQYTLSTAGKVIDFITQASIQLPDSNGLLQITGGSVVLPGDTVSLWVSAETRKAQRMKIMTFYEGNEVNVSITFKTISNGLTYPAFSQVDVFGMGLSLQVQNFNYVNQNQ